MSKEYNEKITRLKKAILEYLAANGRHYGELTRAEQSVEDLAQALNTRLDQLSMNVKGECPEPKPESPRERLSNSFLEAGALLAQGGNIDTDIADQFEASLDLLDQAADYRRLAGSRQDKAETAIIKEKRNQGS